VEKCPREKFFPDLADAAGTWLRAHGRPDLGIGERPPERPQWKSISAIRAAAVEARSAWLDMREDANAWQSLCVPWLRELWRCMRSIHGAPAPPKMPRVATVGDALEAVDLVVAWCDAAPSEAPRGDDAAVAGGPWSAPDTPRRWGKVFGCSAKTFIRRAKAGILPARKLSDRSYQVAISAIPADHK